MKIDNLHLLESIFRRKYRHRVSPLIQALVEDNDAEAQSIIKQHCVDMKQEQNLVLSPDFDTLKKRVKKLQKALRNRVKAFKIMNGEEDVESLEMEEELVTGEDEE